MAIGKQRASKLITKDNFFAFKPKSKNIVVSSFDRNGNLRNRYIKNTKANRKKIIAVKGKPDDFYNGRYVWM